MTRPPGFTKLTGSAGLWPAAKPGFASLANSSLGDAGGPADGFDAGLLNLLHAFSAAGSILDAITAAGAAATAAQASAEAIKLPELDAAIDAATAASNAQLSKIGAALGLLAQSPSSPAGLGAAPIPPVVSIGSTPCGGSSGGVGVIGGVAATQVGEQAAMAVGNALFMAGDISAATLATLGVVVPIVGAAIALGLLLAHFLGHGCGSACIEASKAEQIYEAAADNIAAVYKAGMMSLDHALASMVYFISAGQQHEATFADKQGDAGSKNLTQVIRNEMAGVKAEPKPKPAKFNLAEAHSLYTSGPGWYPDSLAAAANLTDEYLQALANGGQV